MQNEDDMKLIVFISLILLIPFTSDPSLAEVRALYEKAAGEEEKCRELLEHLSSIEVRDSPVLYGYKAGATMIMAKHVFNPFKRMSYFNEGKDMLEEAIMVAPKEVELRFLRFAVQTNAPAFLGYRQHIEEDKSILKNAAPQITDAYLKEKVLALLLSSDELVDAEKAALKKGND